MYIIDVNNKNEDNTMKNEKLYMNTATGSVDNYDGWWYENDSGEKVNAVDLGEVVEVVKCDGGNYCQPDDAATVNSDCGGTSIYDIDTIASYMDDEIREQVHSELAPCAAQKFVDRYCELHKEKFGEEFVIN